MFLIFQGTKRFNILEKGNPIKLLVFQDELPKPQKPTFVILLQKML